MKYILTRVFRLEKELKEAKEENSWEERTRSLPRAGLPELDSR